MEFGVWGLGFRDVGAGFSGSTLTQKNVRNPVGFWLFLL